MADQDDLTRAEKLAAGAELNAEGMPFEGNPIDVVAKLWYRIVDERAYRRRAEAKATTYIWGQDMETRQWWLVECERGEPKRAYHPAHGEKRAFRDTFCRWHARPNDDPFVVGAEWSYRDSSPPATTDPPSTAPADFEGAPSPESDLADLTAEEAERLVEILVNPPAAPPALVAAFRKLYKSKEDESNEL